MVEDLNIYCPGSTSRQTGRAGTRGLSRVRWRHPSAWSLVPRGYRLGETAGFVIRQITRRRFKTDPGFGRPISESREAENLVVEFDIVVGVWRQYLAYITTGLWSFEPNSLQPIGEPVCTPITFAEALSPQRVGDVLPLHEAKEQLIVTVSEAMRSRV
jgi:hypothetical protein